MLDNPTLGRLERVKLREFWNGEAPDFTPWLAQPDNVVLLAEVLGLDLEVEAQEKNVGPFRADILCKDTVTGHYVPIENQLEKTDHTHLGQLMTYAAGLDAVTIVWISNQFTDEHGAALDWLNRITLDTVNFFGLEIELWRIGDSPMAPKFNVVSQPNDWSDTVAQAAAAAGGGQMTEIQQLHLDFWTQFRQFMRDRGSPVKIQKPSKDHWTNVAVGRSNFTLVVVNGMRDNFSELHLTMLGPEAKSLFHLLSDRYRSTIDAQLGPLDWRENPKSKESKIALRRPATPSDRQTWPDLNLWLAENIERWVEVFRPIVKLLDASEYEANAVLPTSDLS